MINMLRNIKSLSSSWFVSLFLGGMRLPRYNLDRLRSCEIL
jgi:hypothetical protein